MPTDAGAYRLFAYAYNGKDRVATANYPVKVSASAAVSAATSAMTPEEKEKMKPAEVKFPFVLFADGLEKSPYNPTGFMPEGIDKVLTLNGKCTDNPHTGKTCIKVVYDKTSGWGGIVWQNPDNDWGKLPGGYNLTGAKVLSFWARGEKGGEKATFGFGLLTDKDKNAYFDTDKGELKDVVLTKNWHPYFIYLDDKDLSRIKTAFWIVTGANNGKATTFYVDDIQYSMGDEPVVISPKLADVKPAEKKADEPKPAEKKAEGEK
jgi:hypothetical protein